MDVDDERPTVKPEHVVGEDISRLSVAELEERIALLKAEIDRLGKAIAEKTNQRSAADSFFKI